MSYVNSNSGCLGEEIAGASRRDVRNLVDGGEEEELAFFDIFVFDMIANNNRL
jgi:hypothetical protein